MMAVKRRCEFGRGAEDLRLMPKMSCIVLPRESIIFASWLLKPHVGQHSDHDESLAKARSLVCSLQEN